MQHRLPSPAIQLVTLLILFTLCPSLRAAGMDEVVLDEQALTQLEQRALSAKPREQCFIYAELVHGMTELAGKQMLAGQTDQASASLKRVERYAALIHMGLANDTKRLKNAEMLMHHTTHRLGDYLHAASAEDKDTLQSTLKQLNQVQDELLAQVFRH